MDYVAVVLYFRLGPSVVDTLDAVRAQTLPPRGVVLVDNASGDGVVDRLRDEGRLDGVAVLTLPGNGGYGAGMNAGVAEAVRRHPDVGRLLLLTHELLLAPDSLRALDEALDAPGVVLAGPTLCLPDGSVWARGGVLDVAGRARHLRSHPDVITGSPSSAVTVTWLDGACLFVDRAALERVGGVEESYFLYWEDVALSLALGEVGGVVHVPAAVGVQAPSVGIGSAFYASRNRMWFWRERRDVVRIVLSVAELLAWSAKLAVTGRRDAAAAAARGCWTGLVAPRPASSRHRDRDGERRSRR